MNHFLSSEMENTPAAEALFHVIPAALEASVSYGGGTGRGPQAILEASDQLELWDGEGFPYKAGIHTRPVIEGKDAETVLAAIEKETSRALDQEAIPVLLGGEHTVTLGAARAVFEKFDGSVGLVQIDAHADLRHNYEGNPYSHASVIRKIHELTGWPVYQVGIRALCDEEVRYQKEKGIYCLSGRDADRQQTRSLTLPVEFPEYLYVTIDVDGLDSSLMPATGTPVPGGLGWYQTLDILSSLATQRKIVAFDCVELAPRDHLSFCDFTAAQLVYNVMGYVQRADKN
ncbi:MAG: agmatinase [Spirochaetales bacterium]|nr:agmatinase [Spirochaetales bacterium]